MSIPEIKVEKEEKMEEQLNEITELCKKFSTSIGMIEKSQYELCTAIQAQSSKEEKLETEIASALNNCNSKIEELHQKLILKEAHPELRLHHLLEQIQQLNMNKRNHPSSPKH